MENSSIIDLSRNDNHLGPNPLVARKLAGFERRLTFYPCVAGDRLKNVLSRYHGVGSEQIVLGNGSVGLLELSARAVLCPGDEVIVPRSTFAVIPEIVRNVGTLAVNISLKNWMIDLQASLAAIGPRTRLVFIVNPNNPTGTVLLRNTLIEFIQRLPPHVYVIVDEAYIDYVSSEESAGMAGLVNRFDNLIVTRTFSKAHGLAALRIGYCIASPNLARRIHSYRLPFTNNAPALEAAALSIQDQSYLARVRAFNKAGLDQLSQGLAALNLPFIRSVTNFISIDFGEKAGRVFKQLKECGVILAPQTQANMPGYLRVTVGNIEENTIFLAHLRQLDLAQPKRCEVYEA